jgi:intracellular sulfur oxidation DsrE/DsrF family protein
MARKLLLHISDRDKWPVALRLVEILMESAPEEQFQVVIVADVFAGGICLSCHRGLRDQMQALVAAGHQIRVCTASLQALNIRAEGLPEFMTAIPNSLAEIPALLGEGYQYLKL